MRIIFKGIVQGVGFRPAVYRTAVSLGLAGAVWNDGSDVVVDVDDGERFLEGFERHRPPLAVIESVERIERDVGGEGFRILGSSTGSDSVSVPADTAICAECLAEMHGAGRRNSYPFISCPDCGPRFTLLHGLPYDRERTVMRDFPTCPSCGREFSSADDRRLHHQTICCPVCGPRYSLFDRYGSQLIGDPIRKFAGNLDIGMIGILKGWGGMHICCIPESVEELREQSGRRYKPFAIMVRDLDSLKRYATVTNDERRELRSAQAPIVLVNKKYTRITENISPGLDNIGVFLPYSGVQHLIFDNLRADALIMTSANVPGEPMVTGDDEALRLGADMYLLHDQPIVNRADDSVMRIFDGNRNFIRRSRGHIPSMLDTGLRGSAVAVGAQENLAGAVAKDGRIHFTQHIGDGENLGVVEYLESALRLNLELTGCTPGIVAADLHPGYTNRRLAKRLAEEYDAEFIEVQHHWAHAASLMAEKHIDRGVFLTLDGTGHGDDRQAWGGEVLYADLDGYERLAHLEYIPLLGSEKALYDLRRLKFAVDTINGTDNDSFNERESAVLRKMMDRSVMTSSMGRILDTLAYSLDICRERTYDGEPAMRLERYLAKGELVPGFETRTRNGVVGTAHLFTGIGKGVRSEDAAYSLVHGIMEELVEAAVERAESEGLKEIGITGGVSYNGPICGMFAEMVGARGCKPLFHDLVPNGDGGISTGQAIIALKRIGS